MSRLLLPLAMTAGIFGYASAQLPIPAEGVVSQPLGYTQISSLLKKRTQSPTATRMRYQRNSAGSKPFITFHLRNGNEAVHRTLVVTADGITDVPSYPRVWYADTGSPAFWLEGGREWYEDHENSHRFFSQWEKSIFVFAG